MELLKTINESNVTDEEVKKFKHRRATRAIVLDNEGKIAVNYSKKLNYYALPGGGMEKGETLEEGVIREAREEAGCDIGIIAEVGRTYEVMKDKAILNEELCFLSRINGEKKELILEEDEIEEGLIVEWLDIDEVMHLLKTVNKLCWRDIAFLEEANKLIKEIN